MGQSWWQLDWVWAVTGWTLAAAGGLLLLWALFWDRSRGRRRCPKCWYDMGGVPGLRCPECGREARKERRFLRTRRRWRWAIVSSLLLALAYASSVFIAVRKHGWPAGIPDSLLAATAPLGPYWPGNPGVRGDGVLLRDLQRRVEGQELSSLAWRIFFSRYFTRYPEEAKRFATTRAGWPRGEHVYAELWHPTVLWKQTDGLILRARLRGSREWAESRLDRIGGVRTVDIGVMPSDGRDAEIEVEMARALSSAPQADAKLLYRGTLRTIRALPPGQDGLSAINDSGLGDKIVAALRPQVFIDVDGQPLLRTDLLGRHIDWQGEDWSLSIRTELVEGDRVIARSSYVNYMPRPGMIVDYLGIYGYHKLSLIEETDLRRNANPLWLRISGDRRVALRDVERVALWAGVVEVPLGGPLANVDTSDSDYQRRNRE